MTVRPRVLVVNMAVEDGTTLPAVGDLAEYPLTFVETDGEDADLSSPWAVTAESVSVGAPVRSRPLGGEPYGPEFWPTLVHGPGWSATWQAPRPVTGPVEVHGRLVADLPGGARVDASVVGRITRLWVISEILDRGEPVPGSRRLRPVTLSPRWFDRGDGRPDLATSPPVASGSLYVFVGPDPRPRRQETGVLVELDLEAAERSSTA